MADLNDKKYSSMYQDGEVSTTKEEWANGMAGKFTSADPSLSNNEWSFLRLTADGKLMVDTELTVTGLTIDNIYTYSTDNTPANARYATVDGDGHVQVDVLSLPVSITEYSEDTAHNTGDKGIQMLSVRNDNNTSLVDTDGDYAPLAVGSTGGLILQGYDETENFTWFKERNPISQHHQTSELVAATGQGDTAGTYYDADMDDYRNFSLHIQNTSGATGSNVYTVEASLDGTNYIDVTSDWFGVANVTDSDAWLEMNTVCVAESVRVKVVRSGDGGSTDGAWTINLKRLY